MVEHAYTRHRQPSLTLKRLGLRVIRGDREAAEVLGDAMQERGVDHILTGRSRPIRFMVQTIASAEVTRGSWRYRSLHPLQVRGVEVLYNVHTYTQREKRDTWGSIWRMWMTKRSDVYRALLREKFLGRKIRFQDVDWSQSFGGHLRSTGGPSELAWNLYLRPVTPPKRRRPPPWELLLIIYSDEPQSVTLDEPGGIEHLKEVERDAARKQRRR